MKQSVSWNYRLALEKDRHQQSWVPREDRMCCQHDEGVIETAFYFSNRISEKYQKKKKTGRKEPSFSEKRKNVQCGC